MLSENTTKAGTENARIFRPISRGITFKKKKKMLLAFAYIGLHALLTAVFILVISGFRNARAVENREAFYYDGLYLGNRDLIKIPQTTMLGIFLVLICALLFALLLMLFIRILKGKTDFAQTLSAVSLGSLLASPFTLLGILVAFFWHSVYLVVLPLLGLFFGLLLILKIACVDTGLDADRSFYAETLSVISLLAILAVFIFISLGNLSLIKSGEMKDFDPYGEIPSFSEFFVD